MITSESEIRAPLSGFKFGEAIDEVLSKLSKEQKTEIDVIETIINININNREEATKRVLEFVEKSGSLPFVVGCIGKAAEIRPKERESIMFLINAIIERFGSIQKDDLNYVLKDMLQVKGIIPKDKYFQNEHVFDFAEKGTVGRAIFDDDVESLTKLLSTQTKEESRKMININTFFLRVQDPSPLECSALFGSVKCFKYLMMNEEDIKEDTCKFAIAGGNIEIVHLCEQKGMTFEGCLNVSVNYHRFDLFEWLDSHFHTEYIELSNCIFYQNEPIFYFNVSRGANVEENYNSYGKTALIAASEEGHLEVVKYLVEQCHANVEAKDNDGYTPLIRASENGHLEVVKYLVEQCHAKITKETISTTREDKIRNYLKSKC